MSTQHPSGPPRIRPASRAEMGFVNSILAGISAKAAGTTKPLNLFTTVARNRGLFRRWILFAGALMPGGKLPRADTELVILRVSHRTGAEYEAVHHRVIGRKVGLSEEAIDAVGADDLNDGPWTERQRLLLAAVDELHDDSAIGDETFAGLRPILTDEELIELCMLAGHYSMVAGLINSARIESDVHRSHR